MKKIRILTVIGLVFSSNLIAQSWFENNPMWSNRIYTWGQDLEYCTVTSDTLLGGRQAKVISREHVNFSDNKRFVAQSGDTIFIWSKHAWLQGYQILYNFDLAEGDTLEFYQTNHYLISYVIDSVYFTEVGGQQLRTQKVRIIYDPETISDGVIIEKIGMVEETYTLINGQVLRWFPHFFFDEPNEAGFDGISTLFCNFQNDLFEYQSALSECDIFLGSQDNILYSPEVVISPNPTTGTFSLAVDPEEIESITGFDISGRKIGLTQTGTNTFSEARLLPAGMYFIEIRYKNGGKSTAKLLRQ